MSDAPPTKKAKSLEEQFAVFLEHYQAENARLAKRDAALKKGLDSLNDTMSKIASYVSTMGSVDMSTIETGLNAIHDSIRVTAGVLRDQ